LDQAPKVCSGETTAYCLLVGQAPYGLKVDSGFRAKRRIPEQLCKAAINAAIAPSEAMRSSEERALVPTLQVQRIRLIAVVGCCSRERQARLGGLDLRPNHEERRRDRPLTGALAPTKTVSLNITTSPEYIGFRLAVMRALEAFPAARAVVLAIIKESEKPHQQAIAGPSSEASCS
jgi:hypothetical protein